MTTLTDGGRAYRVTLPRVVRSEWTKLCALRSTWLVLGLVVVLGVGLAGVVGWVTARDIDDGEVVTDADIIAGTFFSFDIIMLIVGVLGILQMSGEYGSGLIRASVAAVPTRLPLLWAKAIVQTALFGAVALAIAICGFVISQAFLGDHGLSLTDPGVPRAIFGATVSVVALTMIGLAIGTALRHSAAAITTFVGVILVAPPLLLIIPKAGDEIGRATPAVAAQAVYVPAGSDNGGFDMLSPGAGTLVLACWVAVALCGAAAALRYRDA